MESSATTMVKDTGVSRVQWALVAVFWATFVMSAIHPHDYFTWFLETFPALIAFAILVATYRRFEFTTLVYVFICLHCIVLFAGGHWTYARVPLGDWMKPMLHTVRNDYDRIGHFMQGFVPALVAREVLTRRGVLRKTKWQFFLVTCICLAISAAYELFEYGVAVGTGSKADDFLGSQGDPWDTQNDMLTALVASIVAQLSLGSVQDRALRAMPQESAQVGS
jgi:putative membrane protein